MSSRATDLTWEGLLHVVRHPVHSLLTAMTSAIAIAVTVNVISLSFGFEEDIGRTVNLFGRRTVDVSRLPVLIPGARRPPLGPAEEARVREIVRDLHATVVPRRQVSAPVAAVGVPRVKQRTMQVLATGPAYLKTTSIGVRAGRWLKAADDAACALDRAAAERLFPDTALDSIVGRSIEIERAGEPMRFEVVGILDDPVMLRELFDAFDEGAGARTLTSSLLSFRNVYVPASFLAGEEYTGISIVLPDDASVETARERLLTIWPQDALATVAMAKGGIGVFVRRDWMDTMGATTRTGTLLGNVVWMIVVLVAAIMISTLNLITIRERYDEVALRRCEGARRRDVAMQITVEGVVLSLVGGLVGLPIGYGGAQILGRIVDFPFRFELRFALLATGVAIFLGLLSSVVPARHAARLQPARVLGRRLT